MKPPLIRTRFVTGVLILLCLLGTLAVLKGFLPPQPRYQGKPLRFWLAELADRYATRATQIQKAEIAVSAMGTNALPFILRELRTSGRPGIEVVLSRIQSFLWRRLHYSIPIHYTRAFTRRAGAKEALTVLGPALGVPLLAGLMNDSNKEVCDGAAQALSQLEPGMVGPGYQFKSELALVTALSQDGTGVGDE
jgi:hypothetical protein